MKNIVFLKSVLGFAIGATIIIVALADVFNSTHLFNPNWPGHARFHVAMQFTTLVLVSLASFCALFGKFTFKRACIAALAPISFWMGIVVAWLVPGTDIYATEELRQIGFPINFLFALFFIALSALAVYFSRDFKN